MSQEQPCVSWRDYTEQLFKLLEEKVNSLRRETALEFEDQRRALVEAKAATDKRFESVNEFRQTLSNQTGTFMPRSEVESRVDAVASQVTELTNRINQRDGRGLGLNQGWAYLVAAAAIVFGILEALKH